MSIEKVSLASKSGQPGLKSETKISGMIRLRAKTEGMALCVGEKCKLVRWKNEFWKRNLTYEKYEFKTK